MKYAWKVTGKGLYGAPKGAFVQVIKDSNVSSVLTGPDITKAFKDQLGINVDGQMMSNFIIEKLF